MELSNVNQPTDVARLVPSFGKRLDFILPVLPPSKPHRFALLFAQAQVLRAYADSLAESGKQEEAKIIKQRAADLENPETLLHPDPSGELTRYPEHLRAKGDEVSAKRMSILAIMWTHNSILERDERVRQTKASECLRSVQ